jgi:hypothetical protein
MYLSIDFKNPTCIDMAHWVIEALRQSPFMREDVPRFGDNGRKAAYLATFAATVLETIESPDLIDQFCDYLDQRAVIRPSFELPILATSDEMPDSACIDVVAPRALMVHLLKEGEAVDVSGGGCSVRFAPAVMPIVEYLNRGPRSSLRDLRAAFEGTYEPGELEECLLALVDHGLISIRNQAVSAHK